MHAPLTRQADPSQPKPLTWAKIAALSKPDRAFLAADLSRKPNVTAA
jgi:hypothetical protein